MKYDELTPADVRAIGRLIGGPRALKKLAVGKLVVVPAEGWKPRREDKLNDERLISVKDIRLSDPKACLRTRKGRFVGRSFSKAVLAAAHSSLGGRQVWLSRTVLKDTMTGRELLTLWPSGVFNATEFCALLESLLVRCALGDRDLRDTLDPKRPNLFLVEGMHGRVYVVRVDWRQTLEGIQDDIDIETLEKAFGAGCVFFARR